MTELPSPAQTSASPVTRLPGLRLAILAGLLLWLAFPPVGLWPLAWVALAPLACSVARSRRMRQAMWRGYLFGWAFLGITWYWTGLTIVAWTHSQIGWLAWFGLTMLMALYYAAWAGAAWFICQRTTGFRRVLTLAASWAALEWIRTLGSLTMPWAQLGYSQYRFLPAIQIADLVGTPGVSFVVSLVAFALFEWRYTNRSEASKKVLKLSSGIAGVVLLYGILRLAQPEAGPQIVAATMQPNFRVYRDNASPQQDLYTITGLTERAATGSHSPISLWVWPESASPLDAMYDYRAISSLSGLIQKYGGALVTGSRVVDPVKRFEYNSSVLISPHAPPQRYDKQHLVPFGEFIPYRNILPPWLDAMFQFPQSDVVAGEAGRTLSYRLPGGPITILGPFICYESMYPGIARDLSRSGANLLVTQSNDDWTQSLGAMQQHVAGVVLRAVENRRNVVRSTQTGISCILDSRGRILAEVGAGDAGYAIHRCTLISGTTLYARLGDWFALVCLIFTLRQLWTRRSSKSPRRDATTGDLDEASTG